jgi:hypothetical protein
MGLQTFGRLVQLICWVLLGAQLMWRISSPSAHSFMADAMVIGVAAVLVAAYAATQPRLSSVRTADTTIHKTYASTRNPRTYVVL